MFTNIMTGPTAIDVAGVSALGQALVYHEDEEARSSDKWNRELALRLEAEIVTLDSLAHGFAAREPLCRPANRSPARIRLGRVAVAVRYRSGLLRPSLSSVSGGLGRNRQTPVCTTRLLQVLNRSHSGRPDDRHLATIPAIISAA